MLFSVIVPTYNRLCFLPDALKSLDQQTFRDYEVIVVDDGSTDSTEKWMAKKIKSKKTNAPRIKFLRQDNKGPGAARNLGAKHADGEYLAFLDSDDVWMKWTLDVFRQAIEFGKGAAFVSGMGCAFGVPIAFWEKPKFLKFGCMLEACKKEVLPVGGTPSVAVKKTSFELVQGFSPSRINGEDTDLWLRLGTQAGFVKIEKPVVFAQRYHSGNVTRDMECAISGIRFLFDQETKGRLPGGRNYRNSRRRILAAMARTTSLECLRKGEIRKAWKNYWLTFPEQVRQAKIKYLFAFFLVLPFYFVSSNLFKK